MRTLALVSAFLSAGTLTAAPPEKKDLPPGWEVQASGVEDHLRAVAFVSDKDGWAVGDHNTVLRTTDGGRTWARQLERQAKGPDWGQVLLAGPKQGWVI